MTTVLEFLIAVLVDLKGYGPVAQLGYFLSLLGAIVGLFFGLWKWSTRKFRQSLDDNDRLEAEKAALKKLLV